MPAPIVQGEGSSILSVLFGVPNALAKQEEEWARAELYKAQAEALRNEPPGGSLTLGQAMKGQQNAMDDILNATEEAGLEDPYWGGVLHDPLYDVQDDGSYEVDQDAFDAVMGVNGEQKLSQLQQLASEISFAMQKQGQPMGYSMNWRNLLSSSQNEDGTLNFDTAMQQLLKDAAQLGINTTNRELSRFGL
jgi:hypothetical protein